LSAARKAAKKEREQEAFIRIAGEMGTELRWPAHMIASYEDLATPEARFIKMLDKLLPKITHILNSVATVIDQGMTRDELEARYRQQADDLAIYADEFPEVEQLRQVLVAEVMAIADDTAVRCRRCTGTNMVLFRLMPEHDRQYHGR
jgi:hypothetical protein